MSLYYGKKESEQKAAYKAKETTQEKIGTRQSHDNNKDATRGKGKNRANQDTEGMRGKWKQPGGTGEQNFTTKTKRSKAKTRHTGKRRLSK